MGDSIRLTSIVIAVLILGSIGFYQESFADYVKRYYIPAWMVDYYSETFEGIVGSTTQYVSQSPYSSSTQSTSDVNQKKNSNDKSFTRPTFGMSHQDSRGMVENGFIFNDRAFKIKDNYHTVFAKQPVKLGEVNSFEAKVYASEKLRVQEFLFGIPDKGEAHLAELGIEISYDMFGEVDDINVVQKTNVIDVESLTVQHEKVKCLSYDSKEKCDATKISVVFLEPLKDSVMAIKAIDYKNRYQITYLNDGFDISGASLGPLATMMIASPAKYEGLVQVTQTEKYSNYWTTEDGRTFEKNSFDSFKQTHKKFERFQDSGEPKTRLHSGFAGVMAYEQFRASKLFDSTSFVSLLPESFETVEEKISKRIDGKMKQKMKVEEERAKEVLANMPENRHYAAFE